MGLQLCHIDLEWGGGVGGGYLVFIAPLALILGMSYWVTTQLLSITDVDEYTEHITDRTDYVISPDHQ